VASSEPIILLGTHRSGTTWLGEVLSKHPSVAYWEEPRHVWTWGNARTPDDRLTASNARPRVVSHIHETFDAFVRERNKQRLCEKTPSNCLRVPFIHEVYPNAKLLLVVRDGRSVIRSANEMASKGTPTGRIWKRAKETPLNEWPAYAGQVAGILKAKAGLKSKQLWGPRPPGWREWCDEPREVVFAKQWAGTLGSCVSDLRALGDDRFYMFKYEEVMRRPREIMNEIVRFVDLDGAEPLIEHVELTADPTRVDKWRRELDEQTLERVKPIMEPLLQELGYQW